METKKFVGNIKVWHVEWNNEKVRPNVIPHFTSFIVAIVTIYRVVKIKQTQNCLFRERFYKLVR